MKGSGAGTRFLRLIPAGPERHPLAVLPADDTATKGESESMSSTTLVPFAEAAVFTLGCALIASRRFEPQRVGAVLGLATVTLSVLLVVLALPGSPLATLADPDGVRNFLN